MSTTAPSRHRAPESLRRRGIRLAGARRRLGRDRGRSGRHRRLGVGVDRARRLRDRLGRRGRRRVRSCSGTSAAASTPASARCCGAIAVTFFLLAVYVAVEAVRDLAAGSDAEESIVGIVLNLIALAVMTPVAVTQRGTGRQLGNDVLVAQAKETWLSNALSVNVLVGLGINAAVGWAWADPAVALVVAGFAAYAGIDAWREAGERTL